MPIVYLLVVVGLVAGGYYLAKKQERPVPPTTPEDQERKRQEAIARANEIDDQQRKDEVQDLARQRAEREARDEAEIDKKVAKPAYELIKKPDGTMGFWKNGQWYRVDPGQRIMGPFGVYGHFDTEGRFTAEAQS